MGGDAEKCFREQAIPQARFLNVMTDLKDKAGKFPNTFPTKEVVLEVLQRLGVSIDDEVILYGQPGKHIGATRAYIVLLNYGLKNLRVLDGHLKRYTELGYPVEPGVDYTGEPSHIENLEDPTRGLSDITEVVQIVLGRQDNVQIIDTRPADSFNGNATDNIEGCRQGRVPGSINIPAGEFLNGTTVRSDEEIKEILDKYNINPKKKTIVMCRTGMAATLGLVALQKYTLEPFDNLKLYDGSWSEYGSL